MLNMNLQFFAHKKGVGSTKNGRDSESKRLGAKRADGQFVKAGKKRKKQVTGFCISSSKQRIERMYSPVPSLRQFSKITDTVIEDGS